MTTLCDSLVMGHLEQHQQAIFSQACWGKLSTQEGKCCEKWRRFCEDEAMSSFFSSHSTPTEALSSRISGYRTQSETKQVNQAPIKTKHRGGCSWEPGFWGLSPNRNSYKGNKQKSWRLKRGAISPRRDWRTNKTHCGNPFHFPLALFKAC